MQVYNFSNCFKRFVRTYCTTNYNPKHLHSGRPKLLLIVSFKNMRTINMASLELWLKIVENSII